MARKDLIPLNQRTKEEQKSIARKGGIKSGEARRKKKLLKETLEELLELPLYEKSLDELKSLEKLNQKNITVQQAIIIGQIQKALKGDVQSFNAIKELLDDKNNLRFK